MHIHTQIHMYVYTHTYTIVYTHIYNFMEYTQTYIKLHVQIYTHMGRERNRGVEKGKKKGGEKDLKNWLTIVEAGKSMIHRARQQARDSRVPLGNQQASHSPALSSISGCFGDLCLENWECLEFPPAAQEGLLPAVEDLSLMEKTDSNYMLAIKPVIQPMSCLIEM